MGLGLKYVDLIGRVCMWPDFETGQTLDRPLSLSLALSTLKIFSVKEPWRRTETRRREAAWRRWTPPSPLSQISHNVPLFFFGRFHFYWFTIFFPGKWFPSPKFVHSSHAAMDTSDSVATTATHFPASGAPIKRLAFVWIMCFLKSNSLNLWIFPEVIGFRKQFVLIEVDLFWVFGRWALE